MEGLFYNVTGGYLEGIVRGYRNSLLTGQNYSNLTQCETIDDVKLQLSPAYGDFLASLPPNPSTSSLANKTTDKLVAEFRYLQGQATGSLAKFMEYLTYGYMIDNVALLITGTLHERDTRELLERCHPLGWFETMPVLCVATNIEELYNSVLIETPLAPYFKGSLSHQDLDELNIEIVRNTLYKNYLEDFNHFVNEDPEIRGTPTSDTMSEILAFEADRRAINITLNSFGTELSKQDRKKLYPEFGTLYPEGTLMLSRADDVEGVGFAVSGNADYKAYFDQMGMGSSGAGNMSGGSGSDGKSLEDLFYQKEMEISKLAFTKQFTHAPIYAWVKMREQEIRNITWIAECIAQNQKERIAQNVDPLQKYTISAPGINATFIPYGARLTNLYVNDKNGNPQDVALGYDNAADYLRDDQTVHTYFGPVVGRYANRIKNGTFTVQGTTSQIPKNDNMGNDTLHGGNIGYDQRNWTVVSANTTSITFSLLDQAFEGFPGNVITYATYTVSAGPTWTSRLVSIPLDEPTPIMLANHVYWNLGAFVDAEGSTILNHTLQMPYAARYIEIDNIEVPTGAIGTVHGTPYDFTSPKQIGRDILSATNGCGYNCTGYDNAFILDRPRYSAPEATDLSMLTLRSESTGIRLDIYTNQQSLQIYTCDNTDGTIPVKASQQHGRSRTYVEKYGCVVIETQQWIDGVNHPEWGQDEYQIYTVDSPPA
ncbi:MAG: hypothetical protein LQ348_007071, partial [Seirophora lacunosa]